MHVVLRAIVGTSCPDHNGQRSVSNLLALGWSILFVNEFVCGALLTCII